MYLSAKEIVEQYIDVSKNKANAASAVIMGKSILAGMMIAMGAACSSVAAHAIENVGLARLVSGVVFPVGLMMVILMGTELFTGDCLMVVGVCDKTVSLQNFAKTLLLVYIGNFIGSVILARLIYFSGQLEYSSGRLAAYSLKLALGKVMSSPGQKLASGVLCNILVCLAVLMAMAAKDITGKLVSCFFVIMIFVTGGFEHCVANMYYISIGLMAKNNSEYVTAFNNIYGNMELSLLTVKNMLVNNLLPVTIGNILGGVAFVGIPMYCLNTNRFTNKCRRESDELRDNNDSSLIS